MSGLLEIALLGELDLAIHRLYPLRDADGRMLVPDVVANLALDQVAGVRRKPRISCQVEVRDRVE